MTPEGDIEISDRRTEMKYIPLVALLLYQTIAIGAEELPAVKTQVAPYNAPQTILAQLPDAAREGTEEAAEEGAEAAEEAAEDAAEEAAEAGGEESTSKGECEEAGGTWDDEEEECVDE